MADWVAQDSQGKAHVLVVEDREFGELRQRVTAFGEEIKKCSGCKAVGTVDITLGTMVQRLPGLISAQLSANPDIDYIVVPYDSAAFFVGEGVRQAGRTGKVKIAGYEGDPQTIDAIHNGTQAATIADPAEWLAGYRRTQSLICRWACAKHAGRVQVDRQKQCARYERLVGRLRLQSRVSQTVGR